jgi:ribA/ribD-fused uncharacterized protein
MAFDPEPHVSIFFKELPDTLPGSYTYLTNDHMALLLHLNIHQAATFEFPGFVKQSIISQALFGDVGYQHLKKVEKGCAVATQFGPYFVWSPIFENVHTNFWVPPLPITYRNDSFPSSEHAYQAMKFWGTLVYGEVLFAIKAAKSTNDAYKIGIDKKYTPMPGWLSVRYNVMMEIQQIKYQDAYHLEVLNKTRGHPLRKISPNDDYWGSGEDGNGQNKLPEILMRIRDSC